jgi:hypothetical protein
MRVSENEKPSAEEERYYVEIVPLQTDISSLNGPVLFTMLTGQNYFGNMNTFGQLVSAVLETSAKKLFINRSGADSNSSKELKGLNSSNEKLFNKIIEGSWQIEVGDVETLPRLRSYYERIFETHKGKLQKEFGGKPTKEEVVQNLCKRTEKICTERCRYYAEYFQDEEKFPSLFAEKGPAKTASILVSLCKVGGEKNDAVAVLLSLADVRLKRTLSKTKDAKGSDKNAYEPALKFFHEFYKGIKKIYPNQRTNTEKLETILSSNMGFGMSHYDN